MPTGDEVFGYAEMIVAALGVEVRIRQLGCGGGCCFLRMDLSAVTDHDAEGEVVQRLLAGASAVVASTRRATGRLLGAAFHVEGCQGATPVALLHISGPQLGPQP
ncbi:hypothetical protein Kpho01_68150 [Kitasatospora phosalacinea]|uniref:Uncharacterized protein n=2 Tax=Kitasatospora phosalacinea TaxID=2065 RepID=A0A9W6PPU7_9ACTN|nr:hypothetical protein [Kitasatospora phosalacinea]GLW58804.1 hypothetical protein Kpho01_68150 [Kitasatospora phosalacinea]